MRYLGIVSFTALLSAILLSTHAAVADDGAPVIAHLAFREYFVTIKSSAEGPQYSVRTRSGTRLSDDLTDEQLLAAHPKLHSHIRASHAAVEPGSFIWAGRSESLIEPAAEAITGSD